MEKIAGNARLSLTYIVTFVVDALQDIPTGGNPTTLPPVEEIAKTVMTEGVEGAIRTARTEIEDLDRMSFNDTLPEEYEDGDPYDIDPEAFEELKSVE